MIESILVYGFATITLCSAGLFVTFRHPVHAALGFATSVLAVSGLYLLQRAPFVAAANVVVYAGATIIIFLFVLMFSQRSRLQSYDLKYSNPFMAIFASACLAGVLIHAIQVAVPSNKELGAAPVLASSDNENNSDPIAASAAVIGPSEEKVVDPFTVAALGREMYTRYIWSIELAGTLLLVATIGAILIAQRDAETESKSGALS